MTSDRLQFAVSAHFDKLQVRRTRRLKRALVIE